MTEDNACAAPAGMIAEIRGWHVRGKVGIRTELGRGLGELSEAIWIGH